MSNSHFSGVLSFIKLTQTNKIISGMVLILCLLDLTSRFTNPPVSTSKSFNRAQNGSEQLKWGMSSNDINQLNTMYKKYEKTKKDIKPQQIKQGMSLKEQLAQQGELDALFSGDKKLTLKAIVIQKSPYVLLQVLDTNTNQIELKKYQAGMPVFGYNLTINTQNKITLSKENQVVNLLMYPVLLNGKKNEKV